jgi:hypothetical protein
MRGRRGWEEEEGRKERKKKQRKEREKKGTHLGAQQRGDVEEQTDAVGPLQSTVSAQS